jgi:hypothetical protein
MYKRTELINVDSDVSEELVEEIVATKTRDKKERSWVYLHAESGKLKAKSCSIA